MNERLFRALVLTGVAFAAVMSVTGALLANDARMEAHEASVATAKMLDDDEALLPKLATPYQYLTVENCFAMSSQSTMGYLDRMKWRCIPSQSDRAVICTTF